MSDSAVVKTSSSYQSLRFKSQARTSDILVVHNPYQPQKIIFFWVCCATAEFIVGFSKNTGVKTLITISFMQANIYEMI